MNEILKQMNRFGEKTQVVHTTSVQMLVDHPRQKWRFILYYYYLPDGDLYSRLDGVRSLLVSCVFSLMTGVRHHEHNVKFAGVAPEPYHVWRGLDGIRGGVRRIQLRWRRKKLQQLLSATFLPIRARTTVVSYSGHARLVFVLGRGIVLD